MAIPFENLYMANRYPDEEYRRFQEQAMRKMNEQALWVQKNSAPRFDVNTQMTSNGAALSQCKDEQAKQPAPTPVINKKLLLCEE